MTFFPLFLLCMNFFLGNCQSPSPQNIMVNPLSGDESKGTFFLRSDIMNV